MRSVSALFRSYNLEPAMKIGSLRQFGPIPMASGLFGDLVGGLQ